LGVDGVHFDDFDCYCFFWVDEDVREDRWEPG
jgi:hypothetical protein